MTLIVAATSPYSIWMLADRRLTFSGGRPVDDAIKIMFLDTVDGTAILGYAGLGSTGLGTQPSNWMSGVLRERNWPLEQSLGAIAQAMLREFPPHLTRLSGGKEASHSVVVPAFLGNAPMVYSIDLLLTPTSKAPAFRYSSHVVAGNTVRAPRVCAAGSGADYLNRRRTWMRPLLNLVRAYDRGDVSAIAVANHLARLNREVHLNTSDKTVGPRCIVAWRNRKGGPPERGGGGQFYFSDLAQDQNAPALPSIARGVDFRAIFTDVIVPSMRLIMEATARGEPPRDLDRDKMNQALANVPVGPDEKLR